MSHKRPAYQNIDQKTLQYITAVAPAVEEPQKMQPQRVIAEVQWDINGLVRKPPQKSPFNVPKIQQKPKNARLFSNLFQNNNNGVELFGDVGLFNKGSEMMQKSHIPKIDFKSTNLFKQNVQSNLFDNSQGGLGNMNKQPTIFGIGFSANFPPPMKCGQYQGDSNEQQGDISEFQMAQNMRIDKSKSTGKYNYEDQVKVLFVGVARKYKKNNSDLIQNVQVVLQQDQQTNLVYFLARQNATKVTIFVGYVLQGKSDVRILNNNDQNLQLTAFEIAEGKKIVRHIIKLKLTTAQNGRLLFSKLDEVIKGKKEGEQRFQAQAKSNLSKVAWQQDK